jgi:hypothetical protein
MYLSFTFERGNHKEIWGEKGLGTVWAVEYEKGAAFIEQVAGAVEF